MSEALRRAQYKKLLLAQGALHRLELMQARQSIAELTGRGPSGMLRALSSKSVIGLLTTALPMLLGASRVARLLKRGLLVAGGAATLWSAISRWREQAAQELQESQESKESQGSDGSDKSGEPPGRGLGK